MRAHLGVPQARPSFGATLTDVAIPSQVVLKLFDNDPEPTLGLSSLLDD
jgi:hypothetical protein